MVVNDSVWCDRCDVLIDAACDAQSHAQSHTSSHTSSHAQAHTQSHTKPGAFSHTAHTTLQHTTLSSLLVWIDAQTSASALPGHTVHQDQVDSARFAPGGRVCWQQRGRRGVQCALGRSRHAFCLLWQWSNLVQRCVDDLSVASTLTHMTPVCVSGRCYFNRQTGRIKQFTDAGMRATAVVCNFVFIMPFFIHINCFYFIYFFQMAPQHGLELVIVVLLLSHQNSALQGYIFYIFKKYHCNFFFFF